MLDIEYLDIVYCILNAWMLCLIFNLGIFGPGFCILCIGYLILDIGSWISYLVYSVFRYWMLDMGYLDMVCWILDTCYCVPHAGHWMLDNR